MAKHNPVFALIDGFSEEYKRIAIQLIPVIRQYIDKGLTVEAAVNRAFIEQKVVLAIEAALSDKILEAAAIGYGAEVVNEKALKEYFFKRIWPSDTLNLSQRIVKSDLKQAVINHLRVELKKVSAFREIAVKLQEKGLIKAEIPKVFKEAIHLSRRAFPGDPDIVKTIKASERYINRLSQNGAPTKNLKAAYNELVRKIDKLGNKGIDKAIEIAVKEKARYNAERIARTEIARTQGASFDLRSAVDEDVIATKYTLSHRHPEYDICNVHTTANLYKMGPGVYPKDKHPRYPFHPNCLCIPSRLFRGEVELNKKFEEKDLVKFVNSRPEQERKLLLGKKNLDKFRATGDTSLIRNYDGQKRAELGGLSPKWFKDI